MAKQLGFFVVEMGRQFAGDVEEDALLSVRNELHFNDLYAGTGPSIRVTDRMRGSIPKHATAAAAVWRTTTVYLGSTSVSDIGDSAIKKGLIWAPEHGRISFTVPGMADFTRRQSTE